MSDDVLPDSAKRFLLPRLPALAAALLWSVRYQPVAEDPVEAADENISFACNAIARVLGISRAEFVDVLIGDSIGTSCFAPEDTRAVPFLRSLLYGHPTERTQVIGFFAVDDEATDPATVDARRIIAEQGQAVYAWQGEVAYAPHGAPIWLSIAAGTPREETACLLRRIANWFDDPAFDSGEDSPEEVSS